MLLALAFLPEVLKGLGLIKGLSTMFKLQPSPFFESFVTIPVAGGVEGKIKFKFKRLGKKALREMFKSLQEEGAERDDAEVLAEIVEGWSGVDTEFSPAALETLCDAHPGAATAVLLSYNKEMLEGKAKN